MNRVNQTYLSAIEKGLLTCRKINVFPGDQFTFIYPYNYFLFEEDPTNCFGKIFFF